MTANILDGNLVARHIKEQIRSDVAALRATGITPGLGTILVGQDPGSMSYVKGKHRDCNDVGIESIQIELPDSAQSSDIARAIDDLNNEKACSGFILQLPLPNGIDSLSLLQAIDPSKDADGLHPENLGLLVHQKPRVLPCTPLGIVKLLEHYKIKLASKRIVIVGRGITVGRPLGLLLSQKGIDATVTLCHSKTADISSFTSQADVVIAAAGIPHLIHASDIREGAVCVDVGITRRDHKLIGDFHPSVADKAGWLTPMPGGTGPMTRAMLLSNVVELAR
jgi:methylenetetrahydrofolate dehydrogenase (NADP+)/methenyltetrahydrofolate cyclohydrolase